MTSIAICHLWVSPLQSTTMRLRMCIVKPTCVRRDPSLCENKCTNKCTGKKFPSVSSSPPSPGFTHKSPTPALLLVLSQMRVATISYVISSDTTDCVNPSIGLSSDCYLN